ncbi:MAG: helix-turn-helix transcriptional regulator [Bacteroidetes bacterium]|nr:helix-turn-helix transcriptional regulator [Bacteroidota bacterium]
MKNDILTNLLNGEKLTLSEINQILPCNFIVSPKKNESSSEDIISKLTAREKQIAIKISEGFKNKEIAKSLGIKYETVKTHRKNIFRKLHLKDISQLIKLFIQE